MTGYELSHDWFEFCFDNPEKVKPGHTALYFFIIEHCNRLGWKNKFGLPTEMTKEAIGIKSYNTYIDTLRDLVDWNYITLIEKSKNQYSSNIISINKLNTELALSKNDKALDKAMIKHDTKHMIKQGECTYQSMCSINKLYNNKPLTNNIERISEHIESVIAFLDDKEKKQKKFNFKNALIELGVEEKIVTDWLLVRKNKSGTNTETAFNSIKKQIELSRAKANDCIKMAVEKSWCGFEAAWYEKNKTNGNIPTRPPVKLFKDQI